MANRKDALTAAIAGKPPTAPTEPLPVVRPPAQFMDSEDSWAESYRRVWQTADLLNWLHNRIVDNQGPLLTNVASELNPYESARYIRQQNRRIDKIRGTRQSRQ